jgi:tetratricopeptide (TPR) repeat protein
MSLTTIHTTQFAAVCIDTTADDKPTVFYMIDSALFAPFCLFVNHMHDVSLLTPPQGVNAILHSLLVTSPNSSAAVTALLDAADKLASLDQLHAISLYEETAARATQLREAKPLARALIGQSWLLALRGMLDRALTAATRARYASDTALSPVLACDADYVIAWIRTRAGDYDGAIALWRSLISAARQLNDPGREAGYTIELGNTLQFAGRHTEAVDAQNAAYELDVQREARPDLQAGGANNIAMALLNGGQVGEALNWAQRAQRLIENPEALLARQIWHTLALCQMQLNDFAQARHSFEQARPRTSAVRDAHFDAELAIDIGRLHHKQGHTAKAIAALEAGLAHADGLHAAHLQRAAHTELHAIYTAIGALEQALLHCDTKNKLQTEQAAADRAAQAGLLRAQDQLVNLHRAWQSDVFARAA